MSGQTAARVVIGAVGVGAVAFGAIGILSHPDMAHPLGLGRWLIGALLIHDVLIAPLVLAVGWLLNRVVPRRARPFVQGALITAGLVSVLGVLLIWRQGTASARSLTLLDQNYVANLGLLLVLIAATTALAYLIAVSRTRRMKDRSPRRK